MTEKGKMDVFVFTPMTKLSSCPAKKEVMDCDAGCQYAKEGLCDYPYTIEKDKELPN